MRVNHQLLRNTAWYVYILSNCERENSFILRICNNQPQVMKWQISWLITTVTLRLNWLNTFFISIASSLLPSNLLVFNSHLSLDWNFVIFRSLRLDVKVLQLSIYFSYRQIKCSWISLLKLFLLILWIVD